METEMETQNLLAMKRPQSAQEAVFRIMWPELAGSAPAVVIVNPPGEHAHEQSAMGGSKRRLARAQTFSGDAKAHTQCFVCSRIFFDVLLEQCPRCSSRSLRHYTSGELNMFARPGFPAMYDGREISKDAPGEGLLHTGPGYCNSGGNRTQTNGDVAKSGSRWGGLAQEQAWPDKLSRLGREGER
jgi:hypothetical protein